MWSAIQHAKQTVWLETYILKPDAIGLRTIKELTDAAKRGVRYLLSLSPSLAPVILFVSLSFCLCFALSNQTN
jgi:hypothetical protein